MHSHILIRVMKDAPPGIKTLYIKQIIKKSIEINIFLGIYDRLENGLMYIH